MSNQTPGDNEPKPTSADADAPPLAKAFGCPVMGATSSGSPATSGQVPQFVADDGRPAPAIPRTKIRLEAYVVSSTDNWTLMPAPARRDWMDQTHDKFAYRCLPLVMANQAGWILTCPLNFSAVWGSRDDRHGVVLNFPEGEGRNRNQIRSHFGHGIVTFSLPWLFRTEPGYGMLVRGPTNYPKDNLTPLDGIVETDWAPYTFTMNWRIQRRNTEVFFKKGEPICMITPFPLAALETVEPQIMELRDNPEFARDFQDFVRRRDENLRMLDATRESSFQMDYMRGHKPDGTPVEQHRKAFKLAEFKK